MASTSGLSLEAVRDFILSRGGKVTNHDLVKHFKDALTNPEYRAEARNEFKEIVNTVATIVRNEEGEKYLVLKKRYRTPDLPCSGDFPSPGPSPKHSVSSSSSLSSLVQGMGMSHSASQDSLDSVTSPRNPPPYRPPPPPVLSSPPTTSPTPSVAVTDSPPVPPRRRSSEKIKLENKENSSPDISKRPKPIGAEAEANGSENVEDEAKVSVKEFMQKFQRMASENALQKLQVPSGKKRHDKGGSDREDDTVSVTSLDPKAREWLVRAAQTDYQKLAKMLSENPQLIRLKDPFTGYTALHWAAKHGNLDVVKLLAGAYKSDVNSRTNGGYTALHLASQFDHEETYNILVQAYGADPNIRDWSGRKPRQYQTNKDTAVSADTFRKIKARKKHSEKDLGFLRIGSLNVRVKRTTEAFSNYFLGSGSSTEKLHKTWGSADNIPEADSRKMPPPKFGAVKKRKSRRGTDFTKTHSLPLPKPDNPDKSGADSDSDSAAGFGTVWQGTV